MVDKILTGNFLGIYFELYGESRKRGVELKVRNGIEPYLNDLGLKFDEHYNDIIYHLAINENENVLPADNASLPAILQQEVKKFFTPMGEGNSLADFCKRFWLKHKSETVTTETNLI